MISGRRRAPGHLGAYYQNVDVIPIGIGSYEAVSGSPEKPGAPEQALLTELQATAPAGPYTTWAEESDDSGFKQTAPRDRLLYVLTDAQLARAERTIGEPPGYLAVLTDRPGDIGAAAAAFADGRYRWVKTEALYSQADPNPTPKMVFLHWAELRPMSDWKGRSASERLIASRLGGVLVFPQDVAPSAGGRAAPEAPFDAALKAQFPGSSGAFPQVVSHPEAGDPALVRAIRQESATNALMVLGIMGCGALAAYAGYHYVQQHRRQFA